MFGARNLFLLSLGIFFLLGSVFSSAYSGQFSNAKIGIQVNSNKKIFPAKSRDKLQEGGSYKVFIEPTEASWVYIIKSTTENSSLLKAIKLSKNQKFYFPENDSSLDLGKNGDKVLLSVVNSPSPIQKIEALFKSSSTPYSKWSGLEEELTQQTQNKLTSLSSKPISIAGAFRSTTMRPVWSDKFLPVFSAAPHLIRKFEFDVQK
jgi:hypothetical protein